MVKLPIKIEEVLYYLQNKPYFVVYVLKNGRKVKRFIQLAASKEKGSDVFLISKELNSAWWKPDKPIIDGLKFLTFVDLNNGIPLIVSSETDIKTGENFIKEYEITTISEDIEKQKKEGVKNGIALTMAEISFPPTLLMQTVEAHFVKEIMSFPPNKNEWMATVLIVLILVVGAIGLFWFMKQGGGIKPF